MFRRSSALLAVGWSLLLIASLLAEERTADLIALRAAREPTDGPGLLAFFKKRTLSPQQREKIAGLIRQLGDDEYTLREKATTDLIDLGSLSRTQVSQALKDDDLEIRKRARIILTKLGPAATETQCFAPAARVLAQRKPDGAAKVLLDFLPCIEDPEVAEEVAAAVAPLALTDGKPDPAVLTALEDRLALKRFAAGCAIGRLPTAEGREAAYKLLKDADAGVRRRVALALLETRDKTAMPTLIALLTASSADDFSAAEEALYLVAGEKAPAPLMSDSVRAREAFRKSWEDWWKEQEDKLDLAKVDLNTVSRGLTLVTTMNTARASTGSVMEMDSLGKVKWKIENVNYPVHASMTRRNRVLVCEYNGNRVTERDLKGNILWEKQAGHGLLSAERLPDGNTFIVTRNQLLEVDKHGNLDHVVNRVPEPLLAGHRNKEGTFTVLTMTGNCMTLSRTGLKVRAFYVGSLQATGLGGVKPHFLAKGGVVIPDLLKGEIREYDESGKVVRTINAFRPSTVVKLANGNYLVASRLRQRVYEIDKEGREVSSRDTDGQVQFIDRR